jgi:hypothetical protein
MSMNVNTDKKEVLKPEIENGETVQEPIVRKKGRPRKNVSEIVIAEKKDEEKKKRGRKKKECVVEEVKKKKKRGRKAAVKFFSSSIRKKIPLTTVMTDNNGYILHLDVKEDDDEESNSDVKTSVKNKLEYDCQNTNVSNEKNHLLNMILYKLKKDNKEFAEELEKEYDNLLENDNSILSDFLDNPDSESNLRELFEKRIENREKQDKLLIDKLENLHKENELFDKITFTEDIQDSNKNVDINLKDVKDDLKDDNRKKGFFEILSTFIDNKEWVKKTDICCWWCCHQFDTVPLGLPIYYNSINDKFQVKGIFCSFACIMGYNNNIKSKSNKFEYLIKFLYKRLTGAKLSDNIKTAPPRCSLKMFGGELTIEEFRNSFNENKIYKLVEYPMFVSKDYIEEIDIKNIKKVNKNVFNDNSNQKLYNLDEQRISDAKTRLSKIDNTIVTIGNTIDKFIM